MKATKSADAEKNSVQIAENTAAPITLRDRYLLEAERIKYEIGDLDQMRARLGLSQRKVCQMLLVDPSAWTRWNKTGAPPHIYQALKWLLELKKLNPDAVAPSDVSSRIDFIQSSTQAKLQEIEHQVSTIERALTVTATPTYQSASSTIEFESLLRSQEKHFQTEISELKQTLQQLLQTQITAKKTNKRSASTQSKSVPTKGKQKRSPKAKTKIKRKTLKAAKNKRPIRSAKKQKIRLNYKANKNKATRRRQS